MSERGTLFFIDNLRITLIAARPTGQPFGPAVAFGILRTRIECRFWGLTHSNRSFFMNLFFIISGYFLPAPYDRKGAKDFLNDRLRRFLGGPLLPFFFVVILVMNRDFVLHI